MDYRFIKTFSKRTKLSKDAYENLVARGRSWDERKRRRSSPCSRGEVPGERDLAVSQLAAIARPGRASLTSLVARSIVKNNRKHGSPRPAPCCDQRLSSRRGRAEERDIHIRFHPAVSSERAQMCRRGVPVPRQSCDRAWLRYRGCVAASTHSRCVLAGGPLSSALSANSRGGMGACLRRSRRRTPRHPASRQARR